MHGIRKEREENLRVTSVVVRLIKKMQCKSFKTELCQTNKQNLLGKDFLLTMFKYFMKLLIYPEIK